MVVKRAWPCGSRLVPVDAPMGFSGDFSRVGRRVFSAQSFSAGEGWRPSNTSAMGFSATCGLDGFFSAMWSLLLLDHRGGQCRGQGTNVCGSVVACGDSVVRNRGFITS